MPIPGILTLIAALVTSSILVAEEPTVVRDASSLDPDSPDLIGEFHRVGFPKYTAVDKQVIDRAKKLQDEHTAVFNNVEIGKSALEYPGLIAMGSIHYDPHAQVPYTLTIGIRPHLALFAGSFTEYRIEFDVKGVIKSKRKVQSEWNKEAEKGAAPNP